MIEFIFASRKLRAWAEMGKLDVRFYDFLNAGCEMVYTLYLANGTVITVTSSEITSDTLYCGQ